MDDSELISMFFARTESALEAFTQKYGRLMRGIAGNILRDERDAEECVQDACLAVWNSIPPKKPDSLMAYAAGVVRNISTKRYHSNTAKKRNSFYDAALDELIECLSSKDSPENEVLAGELTELLNRFLANEKADNRVIFVRRYWFSDSIPDIARRLGMTENNVSVRLHRTRERLRNYLEKEGYSL